MRIGSLFSGIGGLEMGLERAGLGRVVWQIEIDPFCRGVLAKHWPDVERFDDVRTLENPPPVDVVCGGFPCTDLSHAARGVARTGLEGPASGLWREFRRIVSLSLPRIVVVENVADAWRDWLPVVRRDLHGLGFTSMPIRMRAADVGSPMGRPRVFVVAYAHGDGERLGALNAEMARASKAIADRADWHADPAALLGVVTGVPDRSHRLRALGNAVVPQCAEAVGRAIVATLDGVARP